MGLLEHFQLEDRHHQPKAVRDVHEREAEGPAAERDPVPPLR